ncbi:MAG: alkaline phosphatase family protein [Acidobacteriota bacterium]|nr:alkaline phosphatase family protein [Acidobacteriota bacterium]
MINHSISKSGTPRTFAPQRIAGLLAAIVLGICFVSEQVAAKPASRAQRARIILLKVDGLPGLLIEAALAPQSDAVLRLPFPERFREDYRATQKLVGREELLPNIREYFVRQGVRAETIFTGTLPLSAPVWAQIDSGQPSIVKRNYYFNRASGASKVFLNGLLDSAGKLIRGSGRTHALWELDLLRIPILPDAFPPERVWSSLQTLSRKRSAIQLGAMGKFLVRAGRREFSPGAVLHQHLSHLVAYPDHVERLDQSLALTLAKWLKWRAEGDPSETLDFITALFVTLDHRFHLDSSYRSVLHLLVKLDDWFGEIMGAVEQTARRNRTLVAMVSDHGMNLYPVHINYGFPINPWLRRPEFGGHTVLSPEVEDSDHALTRPIPGVDFARVYESPTSPYGETVPFGAKGYFTAFAANMGNPRFDLFLRHSDLNRLHLLLLDSLRLQNDVEKLDRVFEIFQPVFRRVRPWLEADAYSLQQAAEVFEAWSERHLAAGMPSARDAGARLASESRLYRNQAAILRRLLALPSEEEEWRRFIRSGFEIDGLVPKGYFGPPNSLEQLANYTVGWAKPASERWSQSGEAPFLTLSYPDLITGYRALNPDAFGNRYPFNFFVAPIPPEVLTGWKGQPLRQALWLMASENRGQAALLEATDGTLWYGPLKNRGELARLDGAGAAGSRDPLGYPDRLWARWLDPRRWVSETARLETSLAPVILADLFRPNFEDYLSGKSRAGVLLTLDGVGRREDLKRALRFRFRQATPDFRVWMRHGWNVNTMGQQPAGSHGGFLPLETQTTFMVWGGDELGLKRGRRLRGAFLTLDIAPTLMDAIGRLDRGSQRIVPDPDHPSGPEFPPFPGRIIPIRQRAEAR